MLSQHKLIIFVLVFVYPFISKAEIFKCEINGKTLYQDQECPAIDGSKQSKVYVENNTNPLNKSSADLFKSYEYIGKPVSYVSKLFNSRPNSADNFTAENKNIEVLFESSVGFVSFVDIRFKNTAPCSQKNDYDYTEYMRTLGLDMTFMLKISGRAYYANSFKDIENRLKVTFMCPYDGGMYSVSFSQRYYQ